MASLRGGGAERVMLTVAHGLADRGEKVDLVLANAVGDYLDQVPDSIRIVDLSSTRLLRAIPRFAKYLIKRRPRIVISVLPHVSLIALWVRRIVAPSTIIIVSEHNTLSQSIANAQTIRGRKLDFFMRFSYPSADKIIAVSSGVADDLSKVLTLPRSNIDVICNPVVNAELLEKSKYRPIHSWFEPDAPPVVLDRRRDDLRGGSQR